MRTLVALVLAALLLPTARAAAPTDESIEALLQATQTEALLDTIYVSVEQAFRSGMAQATAGKTVTAEQQRVLELAPGKLMVVVKEELNWEKLKPLYLQVYRESFTQEDIDGLLLFYRSPTGQVFVNKMPAVMQRSMQLSQMQMQSLGPKLRDAMKQALADAKIQ